MTRTVSREIRLASRPKGLPTPDNFALVQTELEPLEDQHVLVRNQFMSVDPYMRGRMNDVKSYVPPFQLGKPLDGGAVGEVVESRERFSRATRRESNFLAGAEYFMASPQQLNPVNREIQPLSVYLGALGRTGVTTWAGLTMVE